MAGIDMNMLGAYVALIAFIVPFVIVATNWIIEYYGLKSKKRRREEANENFNKIVESLASENNAAQLSAAILLRKFLTLKIGRKKYLHQETINVISSILRIVPTGVYQKTLADGLAYGVDLSNADLQKTNLQNVYLGSKHASVRLNNTDLFMANLSYGLIDSVDAIGVVLYNAHLYNTIIKNSNFSDANFVGADLTNVKFTKVVLKGAKFHKATNIPKEIADALVDGVYPDGKEVTTQNTAAERTIFFSMPGNMSKNDELIVLAYRQYMTEKGFNVVYYNRDTYPQFGQLSQIKSAIKKSAAMIVFGAKQTLIRDGIYRPGMIGEKKLSEQWISTPWNEVEVGMAVMSGLSILLVKDDDIDNGIFDEIISESYLYTISSGIDVKELEKNAVFSEWLSKIPS